MEIDENEGHYIIKGGRTILGKLYSYQEKTGLSYKEIMRLPYILFVIGMLDAPTVDYEASRENKKEKNKSNNPNDAAGEMAAFSGFLG